VVRKINILLLYKMADSNNNQNLLYFFIDGDRLEELYKKLFTDKEIKLPFIFTEGGDRIIKTSDNYKYLNTVINDNYIFEIDININNGKLINFSNKIVNNGTINEDVFNRSFAVYIPINTLFDIEIFYRIKIIKRLRKHVVLKAMEGYLDNLRENDYSDKATNTYEHYFENLKDEDVDKPFNSGDPLINKIGKYFKTYMRIHNDGSIGGIDYIIEEETKEKNKYIDNLTRAFIGNNDNNINCNIKCKFFIMNSNSSSKFYMDVFNKDKDKINKIFISDDYAGTPELNKYLNNFSNNQPEIILLPCLHSKSNSNMCKYNDNVISENCSIFQGRNIDTGLYTDFYGEDKVRKPSYIYYADRKHCRDTNIISLVLNNYYSDTPRQDIEVNQNELIHRIKEDEEDYGESHAGGRRNPTKKTKKTKNTKKTRKPRKKSRKSRKHKKSRKH